MELKTYFAQDAAGNIISSAIVNVFLQGTTTLATGLTRADGTPLENPFAADGAGRIQFRAPDGYYDVQVSAGPGIIQTLTIQCVDYAEAKANADRAEAAADRADVSAEQVADAVALRGDLSAAEGSKRVGFSLSAIGAAIRTVFQKLLDVAVSPEDFGAVGDGVADDSDALDACFAASNNIILNGNYRRTRPLAIVGGKRIAAATTWTGRIYFDGCDAGTHTLVNRNDQAVWEGVSLLAISKGTKIGLIAVGNGLTNRLRPFIFRNCNFSGADLLQQDTIWPGESEANIQEWNIDLRIKNASFSLVESCAFTGKATSTSSGWDTGTTGIIVESSTYVSILNSKGLFKKFGYALVGSTEGFADINNQWVDCYDGGTNQQHGGTIGPANNWVVQGGHCDCSHRGLDFGLHNNGSMGGLHTISGRLFLKRESGGVSDYAAISLNVSRSTVYGNVIQTNGSTADYVAMGDSGIRIAGIENSIFGNIGRNCGTLVDLVVGSVQNLASNNRLSKAGTATSRVSNDAGTLNVLSNNTYNSGSGAHRVGTQTNQLWGAGNNYAIDVNTSGLAPNYDSRLDFTGGNSTDGGGTITIRAGKVNTTAADFNVNIIRPNAANTYPCATSTLPWSGGFTQTAFTITSDADCKSDPLEMTDAILDAAEEVQLVQYQYLDRIEEKGPDGARWHFGAIAQRYVEAFERHGLDAHRFGFICYDEWDDVPAVIDEDTGDVITPAIEAGSRYGIRYEEMLVMEAALQRRRYGRLLEKHEKLSARIDALEAK